jgi:hypothetical protein
VHRTSNYPHHRWETTKHTSYLHFIVRSLPIPSAHVSHCDIIYLRIQSRSVYLTICCLQMRMSMYDVSTCSVLYICCLQVRLSMHIYKSNFVAYISPLVTAATFHAHALCCAFPSYCTLMRLSMHDISTYTVRSRNLDIDLGQYLTSDGCSEPPPSPFLQC